MGLDLYAKAVEIIGEVPSSCEFLYCIGAIILFLGFIGVILSPFLIFRLVGGK